MQFQDTKFKELDAQGLITDKLNQIKEFETKYKSCTSSIAMYKWCTDYEYRKREWQFRQGIANYAAVKGHEAFQTSDKSTF